MIEFMKRKGGGQSTPLNLFAQDTQPEGYQGIWIKDSTWNNKKVVELRDNSVARVSNAINILRGTRIYETILCPDINVLYRFQDVILIDENGNIVNNVEILIGTGTMWIPLQLLKNMIYKLEEMITCNSTAIDTGVSQSSISTEYTIFITLRPTTWARYKGAFGDHGGNNQGIVGFQYTASARVDYCHIGSETGYNAWNEVGATNQTHNIIIAFADNKLSLWKNGVKTLTDFTQSNILPLGNIVLGRSLNSSERYFQGQIGYVYIFNRALSNNEIEIMNEYINYKKYPPRNIEELDYLESSGTQYIATDLIPSVNKTIECEYKYTNVNTSADDRVIGIEANSKYLILGRYQNNTRFVYGNGSAISTNIANLDTNRHVAKIGYDSELTCGVRLDNIAKTSNISSSYVFSDQTINLFATTGGQYKSSGLRIYGLKVLDNNGVLINNLVPARDIDTNEIGFYDKITRKWYGNAGTGNFITDE